ncbi:MAG: ADP-ribosylglycohydrolase family protein, partial [Firmicutes bacterium]|nr:ADP-ribosylglycohydrolase family protein [Bacillota bacterium]
MVALESAIYGLAVGDALGVPFESKRRGSFVCDDMIGFGVWNKEPGTWSDDTSMTLATCKSIKDQSGIDPKDIRKKFEEWLYKAKFTSNNEVFDVGNTTREAIELGFGIDDFYANGNGSLMRILPLAFTDATDNEIKEISAITHAHKLSKDVCVTYVHIARKMMNGKKFQDRRLQNKKENE